jgi:hypothetical protein
VSVRQLTPTYFSSAFTSRRLEPRKKLESGRGTAPNIKTIVLIRLTRMKFFAHHCSRDPNFTCKPRTDRETINRELAQIRMRLHRAACGGAVFCLYISPEPSIAPSGTTGAKKKKAAWKKVVRPKAACGFCASSLIGHRLELEEICARPQGINLRSPEPLIGSARNRFQRIGDAGSPVSNPISALNIDDCMSPCFT